MLNDTRLRGSLIKRISDALLSESLRARSIRFLVTALTSFGLFRWSAWLRLRTVNPFIPTDPEFALHFHAGAAVAVGLAAASLNRSVGGTALKTFTVTCLFLHWSMMFIFYPVAGSFDCGEAFASLGIAATISSFGLLAFPGKSKEGIAARIGVCTMTIFWAALLFLRTDNLHSMFVTRWTMTGFATVRPSAVALLFLPLVAVILTIAAQPAASLKRAAQRESTEKNQTSEAKA